MASKKRHKPKHSASAAQRVTPPNGMAFWRDLSIGAALIAVTLIIYLQTRRFDFIDFDDPQYITNNPVIVQGLTWKNILWSFTTFEFSNWHPLTWLSYFLDFEMHGMKAGGFHFTNVAFHAANAVLLFVALKRMTRQAWPSAIVAALFAVHPLHVESVAWISERKDVLSTFFGLLAILAYAKYARGPSISRYLLVILAFVLSLMSKPMLVTLPPLLLLLDIWPLRRLQIGAPGQPVINWRRVGVLALEKVPLLFFSIGVSLVTLLAQSVALKSIDRIPLGMRVSNSVVSYATYIWNTIWPSPLAFHYPFPREIPVAVILVSVLVLIAFTIVGILTVRRFPSILVGWLWFLGTLVPVIGIVQVGEQSRADRYTYVPLIGLLIAMIWPFCNLKADWRKLASVFTAIWLLVLTMAAHAQTQLWSSSFRLFQHAATVTKDNPTVLVQLGLAYQNSGDSKTARLHFERALELDPENPTVHNNLGTLLLKEGQYEKALPHFEQALLKRPTLAETHYNLGFALANLGRADEAIESYRRAVGHKPHLAIAHIKLAGLLLQGGRDDEAESHFRTALQLEPDHTDAHYNLGMIQVSQQNLNEAAVHFVQAIRTRPDANVARFSLANALVGLGKLDEAKVHYEELLRRDPSHADAHNNLGAVFARQGNADRAIWHYEKALQLRPDYAAALHNLGDALAAVNLLDRAAATFSQVLALQPQSAILHNKFGSVLLKQGKVEQAISHFSEAIRLDPNFEEAKSNLTKAQAQKVGG